MQFLSNCGHTDWGPCAPTMFSQAEKVRIAVTVEGMRFIDSEVLSEEEDTRTTYYREYYDGDGCGLSQEDVHVCAEGFYTPDWDDNVPVAAGVIRFDQYPGGGRNVTERITLRNLLLCEVPEYRCVYNEDCNDQNPCTQNLCVGGLCEFPADDSLEPPNAEESCASCKDGAIEYCDCRSDQDCNDGNLCTTNNCNDGVCVTTPNDAGMPPPEDGACRACHNGVVTTCPCTGGGECNDNNPCTHDFCSGDRCKNRPDDSIVPPQDPGDCRRCVGGQVVSAVQSHEEDCTTMLQGVVDVCTGIGLRNWRIDYSEMQEDGSLIYETFCSGERSGAACDGEGIQDVEGEDCPDTCAEGGLPYVYRGNSDRACASMMAGTTGEFQGICTAICSGCR